MKWYVDASIALHAVLPWGDQRALDWMATACEPGSEVYSSTLLRLEIIRALRRERLDLTLAHPVFDRISLVSLDDGALRVAGAIEPHIKSLDAIHLAACAMLGSGITLATHDANMAAVATQLGLETFDPRAGSKPGRTR